MLRRIQLQLAKIEFLLAMHDYAALDEAWAELRWLVQLHKASMTLRAWSE